MAAILSRPQYDDRTYDEHIHWLIYAAPGLDATFSQNNLNGFIGENIVTWLVLAQSE